MHNCWDYVYYIGYLNSTAYEDLVDYADIYVKKMIDSNKFEWFPCYFRENSKDFSITSPIQGISSRLDTLEKSNIEVRNSSKEMEKSNKEMEKSITEMEKSNKEMEKSNLEIKNSITEMKQSIIEIDNKIENRYVKIENRYSKIEEMLSQLLASQSR